MLSKLGSTLLLATTVVADLASIQGALDTINAGLLNLDNAVLGLPATALQLTAIGQGTVPLLANATAIIQQSAVLTIQETLSLNVSTAALRQNANVTINDLIAKKPFFDALNQTQGIIDAVRSDGSSAAALGAALLSKLPDVSVIPGGPETAMQAINELNAIFNRGLAIFSGATPAGAVAPPPTGTGLPPPSALTPVSIPVPGAAVQQGRGMLNADGSCTCAVQCPAGSMV